MICGDADKAGCAPGDARCYGFPYPVRDPLASRTSVGWCLICFAAGDGGRLNWGAWYTVHTGEGRLRH